MHQCTPQRYGPRVRPAAPTPGRHGGEARPADPDAPHSRRIWRDQSVGRTERWTILLSVGVSAAPLARYPGCQRSGYVEQSSAPLRHLSRRCCRHRPAEQPRCTHSDAPGNGAARSPNWCSLRRAGRDGAVAPLCLPPAAPAALSQLRWPPGDAQIPPPLRHSQQT